MVSFALKLEPRGLDAAAILTVRGDLDMYTVPEFQERLAELAETERDGLVVDLTETTFVDTRACRALLRAARRLRDQGAMLVVVNQDPEVRRVFDVMGLDEFLTVVATRSEATCALAAA